MPLRIDPRVDCVFKALLGDPRHKGLLLHFLNAVPIQLIHDRWVSKYAEAWTEGLSGLKSELEKEEEAA